MYVLFSRLERSFITAQHEGAQTMEVKKSEDAPKETIKLIPGQSEHDLVQYKAGYAMGPENPNPTNEVESELFAAESVVREREEQFRAMREAAEAERKEREQKFREEERIRKRRVIANYYYFILTLGSIYPTVYAIS